MYIAWRAIISSFFEYPNKKDKKVEFYNKLRDHHQINVHLLPVNINTESNVGFEVLNKILCNFSLEKFPEHWGSYTHPNPTLKQMLRDFLRYRNGVAHGGDISSEDKVTKQVYEKYKNLVVDLMYGVMERINAGFNNQKYKKTPIIC